MQPKVCPFHLIFVRSENATFVHHIASFVSYYYVHFSLLVPGISFVGRLFCHALEESRPKSVLVHSLSVCISLLDPKRLASASYQAFRSNLTHGTLITANPETVDGMLESLGECYVLDSFYLMLLVLFICFSLVTPLLSVTHILLVMCTPGMFNENMKCLIAFPRTYQYTCNHILGDLLKLLDITSSENVLPTTYGCLRPPLGKHRLKVCSDAVDLLFLV